MHSSGTGREKTPCSDLCRRHRIAGFRSFASKYVPHAAHAASVGNRQCLTGLQWWWESRVSEQVVVRGTCLYGACPNMQPNNARGYNGQVHSSSFTTCLCLCDGLVKRLLHFFGQYIHTNSVSVVYVDPKSDCLP